MPTYIYEVIRADGKPGKRFEILQSIHEKPLKKHPKTGKAIRRVIGAASLPKNKFERTVKQVYGKNSQMTKSLLHK